MKRSDASAHQFVQRIPADIKGKVQGSTIAVQVGDEIALVRVSEKARDIRMSLRTRDPHEARERQGMVVASVEKAWRTVREGPTPLTFEKTVALAGEWYREMVAEWSAEPGRATEWETLRELIIDAQLDLERDETRTNWQQREALIHPDRFLLTKGVNRAGFAGG
jgi:hypothetical protein